jgi:hypothetical protein
LLQAGLVRVVKGELPPASDYPGERTNNYIVPKDEAPTTDKLADVLSAMSKNMEAQTAALTALVEKLSR